jgi:hypothetical protein
MGAYRLYTVVPELVKFIDDLTNIYVRYNRRRLKGRNGDADTRMALAVLFDTLLTVCKVPRVLWFRIFGLHVQGSGFEGSRRWRCSSMHCSPLARCRGFLGFRV